MHSFVSCLTHCVWATKERRPELRPRGFLRLVIRASRLLLGLLLVYTLLAYGFLPVLWRHYEHHPILETAPKTTLTHEGIPGDPLNVGLVGSETELMQSMLAAGWLPADPVTFRSSLAIAGSVLLRHPYPKAPVSNLYLWGRPQDLAFERPAGSSARQRHHVRWWRADKFEYQQRAFWIGAATYDQSVGLSHLTGKITHHIAPDVDTERDRLFADLQQAGRLSTVFQVSGVGPDLNGRNGGGDRYYTDGEMTVGILSATGAKPSSSPEQLANPVAVRAKTTFWRWLKNLME